MTKEEALLHFPYNHEEEDINDLFESILFEHKQFLSNQMPTSKVFNSRLNRIEQIEQAFLLFEGKIDPKPFLFQELSETSSNSIEENFQLFQLNRNKLKLALNTAHTVDQIKLVIDLLFLNQQKYAEKWPEIKSYDLERPIVSKQPDDMEILSAILKAKSNGIYIFNEIPQLESDNPLVKEAFRLSLWLKLESNV